MTAGTGILPKSGGRGVTVYNLFKLAELFGMNAGQLVTAPDAERGYVVVDKYSAKRLKISALNFLLNDRELDFLFNIIKNLTAMKS